MNTTTYVSKIIDKKTAEIKTEFSKFAVYFEYDIDFPNDKTLTIFVRVVNVCVMISEGVFLDIDNAKIEKSLIKDFCLAIHDYIQNNKGVF